MLAHGPEVGLSNPGVYLLGFTPRGTNTGKKGYSTHQKTLCRTRGPNQGSPPESVRIQSTLQIGPQTPWGNRKNKLLPGSAHFRSRLPPGQLLGPPSRQKDKDHAILADSGPWNLARTLRVESVGMGCGREAGVQ